MKALYILLFVVVLVAGYYFVAGPPTAVVENNEGQEHMDESDMNHNESDNEAGEMEDSQPPEADQPAERSLGDDAGMEFPTIENEAILEEKVFNVTGFNFGYDMKEIRVQKGDRVTINLSVSDGFHDWVVDEFDAATEKIREGGVTSVTFVADEAGTFEYYCSVGSHRAQGMVGKLIVE